MIFSLPGSAGINAGSKYVSSYVARAQSKAKTLSGVQGELGNLSSLNKSVSEPFSGMSQPTSQQNIGTVASNNIEFKGREWPLPPKAAFVVIDNPNDSLTFHFNPPEWSQDQSSNWKSVQIPGNNRPTMQWVSGGPHKISMQLFFVDFWMPGEGRVSTEEAIQWLFKVLYPLDADSDKAPPLLAFMWGNESKVATEGTEIEQATEDFVLTDVKVVRKQFDVNLVTIQAVVAISLEEFTESLI